MAETSYNNQDQENYQHGSSENWTQRISKSWGHNERSDSIRSHLRCVNE